MKLKRIVTFLCALCLLATCFSGVAVQAETVLTEDGEAVVAVQPVSVEPGEGEIPSGEIAYNEALNGPIAPADYAATSNENVLGQAFVDYVQTYIANCQQFIPVEQYDMPTAAGNDMINLIYYESPELFSPCRMQYWYQNGKVTRLEVLQYRDYADTPAEYNQCLQGMRNVKKTLVSGVKGNSNLSKVEKALILHDRLALWTEYDLGFTTTAIYSAVGPLMNQSGVCQGYALAYMYLLDEVGIESDLCSSNQLNHAWNIVYLDGVAYHTDVTWDDPTNYSSDTYYDDLGRVRHVNFLRSTAGIRATGHTAYDYNTSPTNTRYDAGMWWMDTETSIEFIGTNLYYLNYTDDAIWKLDQNDNRTKIYNTSGFYAAKLAGVNGKLLISDRNKVYAFTPATGTTATVFSPSSCQSSSNYIEGMKYEKGKIYVQINCGSYSTRESMAYTGVDDVPEQEPLVKITNTAGNQHVIKNSSISFTVELDSEVGVTYQWQRCKSGNNWTNVSYTGNKTKTVTFDAASWAQYPFRCEITDANGTKIYTESYTYTLVEPPIAPNITSNPKDVYLVSGNAATFSVEAVGSDLTYQWWRSKNGGQTWGEYTGTGGKTSSISVKVYSGQEFLYMCEVKDGYGNTMKSKVVQPHLIAAVKITAQPKVTVSGGTATITFTATGDVKTYQWQRLKNGTWVDAVGANYVGYNTATLKTTVKATWRCRIVDLAGNITYTNEVTFAG